MCGRLVCTHTHPARVLCCGVLHCHHCTRRRFHVHIRHRIHTPGWCAFVSHLGPCVCVRVRVRVGDSTQTVTLVDWTGKGSAPRTCKLPSRC